jgi:hypothetical protein
MLRASAALSEFPVHRLESNSHAGNVGKRCATREDLYGQILVLAGFRPYYGNRTLRAATDETARAVSALRFIGPGRPSPLAIISPMALAISVRRTS